MIRWMFFEPDLTACLCILFLPPQKKIRATKPDWKAIFTTKALLAKQIAVKKLAARQAAAGKQNHHDIPKRRTVYLKRIL